MLQKHVWERGSMCVCVCVTCLCKTASAPFVIPPSLSSVEGRGSSSRSFTGGTSPLARAWKYLRKAQVALQDGALLQLMPTLHLRRWPLKEVGWLRSNGSLRELLQNVGQFRRYLYLLCAVDRTFRVRVHVSIYGSAVTVETVKYSHVRAKLAQVQV